MIITEAHMATQHSSAAYIYFLTVFMQFTKQGQLTIKGSL